MLDTVLRALGLRDAPGTARAVGDVFPALSEHRYLLLKTEKKSGRWVPTPVWFAADGDALVCTTEASSGKVKRIRRSGDVRVAPCDVRGRALGPEHDARATFLEGDDARSAERAIVRRYGLQQRAVDALYVVRHRGGQDRAIIALRPRPGAGDRAATAGGGPDARSASADPPGEEA